MRVCSTFSTPIKPIKRRALAGSGAIQVINCGESIYRWDAGWVSKKGMLEEITHEKCWISVIKQLQTPNWSRTPVFVGVFLQRLLVGLKTSGIFATLNQANIWKSKVHWQLLAQSRTSLSNSLLDLFTTQPKALLNILSGLFCKCWNYAYLCSPNYLRQLRSSLCTLVD